MNEKKLDEKKKNGAKDELLKKYAQLAKDQETEILRLKEAFSVMSMAFAILEEKTISAYKRGNFSLCDLCHIDLCINETSCRESISAYSIAQATQMVKGGTKK